MSVTGFGIFESGVKHGLDVDRTKVLIHTDLRIGRVAPRNRVPVLVHDVVSSTRLRNLWRPQSIVLLTEGNDNVRR
jgi:hypothetical protein